MQNWPLYISNHVWLQGLGLAFGKQELLVYTPEEVEVSLFYMGQGEQGGVVKPSCLNNHLHQITDAQSRH